MVKAGEHFVFNDYRMQKLSPVDLYLEKPNEIHFTQQIYDEKMYDLDTGELTLLIIIRIDIDLFIFLIVIISCKIVGY